MTCQAVRHWLSQARPEGARPKEIQAHLARCRGCRRRQQLLYSLDQKVRALPVPADVTDARDRLWQAIRATPRGRRWGTPWRALTALAAGLLLVVAIWYVARRPDTDRLPRPGTEPVTAGLDDRELVTKLLDHGLRLAAAAGPETRLTTLADLAGDLWGQIDLSVRHGEFDDVPLLSNLYADVLTRGVAGQAARLPGGRRAELLPGLLGRLREMETGARKLAAGALPLVADLLEPALRANAEAVACLKAGRAPDTKEPARSPTEPLVATLVSRNMELAEATEPLRRAELSADLAPVLAQLIVTESAAGDVAATARLGEQMDELVTQGIADNLDAAEAGDEVRPEEMEAVRRRSAQAVDILERNLQHVPAAARPNVQRALRASAHGRQRAFQGGKGKGKGKHGDMDGGRPPGGKGRPKGKGKGRPQASLGERKQDLYRLPVFTISVPRDRRKECPCSVSASAGKW